MECDEKMNKKDDVGNSIKRLLRNPIKANKFIRINRKIIMSLCIDCQKLINDNNGLPDFSLLCPDCQLMARDYEDELNKLMR